MRSVRVPVSGWAHSVLEPCCELEWKEDPEIEAVCAAYRAGKGQALVVSIDNAKLVRDGLVMLSDIEDEMADRRNTHPETRRMARWSSDGLSGLYIRLCRAVDALRKAVSGG